MNSSIIPPNASKVQVIDPKSDLVVSGFRLHKLGIVPQGTPTFEQWQECWGFVGKADGAVRFWRGDLICHAEQSKYGQMYTQFIEDTGKGYITLAKDKQVAEHIEIGRRRPNLTFDHHQEVAYLEPDEQDKLLDIAEEGDIKSKDFRQVVRDYKKKKERALLPPIDISTYEKKVLQGDCLVEMAKLPEKSVDMIYIDPPYNMDKGEWDTFSADDFTDFTRAWAKECLRLLKEKSHLFINFDSVKTAWLENLLSTEFDITPSSRLIWHYRNAGGKSGGKKMLSKTYEPILHYNFGDKDLNFPLDWDDTRFDVWTIAIPQANFKEGHDHPTQKPVELLDRLVKYGSDEGELVLDPMAGSGTTGVACIKNKRDFVLIEKDAEYIEQIYRRLDECG